MLVFKTVLPSSNKMRKSVNAVLPSVLRIKESVRSVVSWYVYRVSVHSNVCRIESQQESVSDCNRTIILYYYMCNY